MITPKHGPGDRAILRRVGVRQGCGELSEVGIGVGGAAHQYVTNGTRRAKSQCLCNDGNSRLVAPWVDCWTSFVPSGLTPARATRPSSCGVMTHRGTMSARQLSRTPSGSGRRDPESPGAVGVEYPQRGADGEASAADDGHRSDPSSSGKRAGVDSHSSRASHLPRPRLWRTTVPRYVRSHSIAASTRQLPGSDCFGHTVSTRCGAARRPRRRPRACACCGRSAVRPSSALRRTRALAAARCHAGGDRELPTTSPGQSSGQRFVGTSTAI